MLPERKTPNKQKLSGFLVFKVLGLIRSGADVVADGPDYLVLPEAGCPSDHVISQPSGSIKATSVQ